MNKLTINWIISTLNKSGINSKKQVRERLQNASIEELEDLEKSIQGIITEKILEQDFKKNIRNNCKAARRFKQ